MLQRNREYISRNQEADISLSNHVQSDGDFPWSPQSSRKPDSFHHFAIPDFLFYQTILTGHDNCRWKGDGEEPLYHDRKRYW